MDNCDVCSLKCEKNKFSGNIHGSVLILGDYPHPEIAGQDILESEDENNIEGRLLRFIFDKLMINREEIFFAYSVACCPFMEINKEKQFRPPSAKEIKNCSIFIKYLVELMHPSLIILLGNVALNIFKKESILKCHGQWLDAFTIPAIPIYSPFYIHDLIGKITEEKRNQLKEEMIQDFITAFGYLRNKYPDAKLFK